ncbi:MAG: MCE family protein [Calditrichaeota bacterium]|nr:MCE family protein [Calditrichota bacterium]
MNRRFVRESRVGALILVAFIVLIIAIFSVGQQQKVFGEKVRYKILFSNINGLHRGDAVMLNGVNVGYVERIQFPEDLSKQSIEVTIRVQKDIHNRIREDSEARIGSLSLVTTRFVSLSMGSASSPPLPPGSYIRAAKSIGYEDVLSSSDVVIQNIGTIAENLQKIVANISEGKGLLGNLITQPNPEFQETLSNLQKTSRDLKVLLAQAKAGKGALGYMLSDTVNVAKTVENLRETSERLNRVSKQLENSQSLIGKLLNDPKYGKSVAKNLADVLQSLKNITAKIDSGKGTLGAMVNDPEMYWALRDALYGVESNRFLRWFLPRTREKGESLRKEMKRRK